MMLGISQTWPRPSQDHYATELVHEQNNQTIPERPAPKIPTGANKRTLTRVQLEWLSVQNALVKHVVLPLTSNFQIRRSQPYFVESGVLEDLLGCNVTAESRCLDPM